MYYNPYTQRFNQASLGFLGDAPACTLDVKVCPDGSTVGKDANCNFLPCPGQAPPPPAAAPGFVDGIKTAFEQPLTALIHGIPDLFKSQTAASFGYAVPALVLVAAVGFMLTRRR